MDNKAKYYNEIFEKASILGIDSQTLINLGENINNSDLDFGTNINSMSDLVDSFDWEESPQGFEYWDKVCDLVTE